MHTRNKVPLSVTIYPHQMRRILAFERQSGLSRSRIVSEMLARAIRTGYTPGTVSLGEMREEAVAMTRPAER